MMQCFFPVNNIRHCICAETVNKHNPSEIRGSINQMYPILD